MDHSLTLESLAGYGDEQVARVCCNGPESQKVNVSGFESHVVSLVTT